jgi:hypothetical protein
VIFMKQRTSNEVEDIIAANHQARRYSFEGWTTAEIAERSRRIMFGDNDEAFPSQEEWSRIVD